jgi:hypothetical protein
MREVGRDGRSMRAIEPRAERIGFREALSAPEGQEHTTADDALRLTTIEFPIAAKVLPELSGLRTGIMIFQSSKTQVCICSENASHAFPSTCFVLHESSFFDENTPGSVDRNQAVVILNGVSGSHSSPQLLQKAASVQRRGGSAVIIIHESDDFMLPNSADEASNAVIPILHVRKTDELQLLQACQSREKVEVVFGKHEAERKPQQWLDPQSLSISARWFLVPTEAELIDTLASKHFQDQRQAQVFVKLLRSLLADKMENLREKMGVLQQRLLEAEQRCKVAVEEARISVANAEGRANFMEVCAPCASARGLRADQCIVHSILQR